MPKKNSRQPNRTSSYRQAVEDVKGSNGIKNCSGEHNTEKVALRVHRMSKTLETRQVVSGESEAANTYSLLEGYDPNELNREVDVNGRDEGSQQCPSESTPSQLNSDSLIKDDTRKSRIIDDEARTYDTPASLRVTYNEWVKQHGNDVAEQDIERTYDQCPQGEDQPDTEGNIYDSVGEVDTDSTGSSSGESEDSEIYEPVEPKVMPNHDESDVVDSAKIGLRLAKPKSQFFSISDFQVNREKHPPPELPPAPEDLSDRQIKRRHIVADIIKVENNYVDSLNCILEDYRKPIADSQLLPQDKVTSIFYKIDEILKCHVMFQIALHEIVSNWDDHESIGAKFVECFSKEMVLEAYTEFIINFISATETLKKCQRDKPAFKELVQSQAKKCGDQIGLHGQMIKVVQRFPQYILQIKDLIKNTPPAHTDYYDLKRAVTILENVAFQLNDKKRLSEEKLAAQVILATLNKKPGHNCCLLRQDDVTEVVYGNRGEILEQKGRRLLLFNDFVYLIKVEKSGTEERISLKWKYPVSLVDYHETGVITRMRSTLKRDTSGQIIIQSVNGYKSPTDSKEDVNESAMLVMKEIEELQHDQAVLTEIHTLLSSLKQKYKGLDSDEIADHLKNINTSVVIRDEQLQMLDSCSIVLSLPGSNRSKEKAIYHMISPEVKQDWVLDFRAVKLAQEEVNKECWVSEVELLKQPLFIKNLEVDVAREQTKVSCAVPIFLTNTSGGIGLQYLWVCSSNERVGQVTLVSLHSSKPIIIHSFEVTESRISCCALVPSNVHSSLDHVWMADRSCYITVHGLKDDERATPKRRIPVPACVCDILCYGNYVFVALENGCVMKFAKHKGSPLFSDPISKLLKPSIPVNSLMSRDNNVVLAACGNMLFELSAVKGLNILNKHPIHGESLVINKMIKHGAGIWFSSSTDCMLRLIHEENYSQVLQDIHIGNALAKLLSRTQDSISISKDEIRITCLQASQGLIWVGTNTGHILNIPVPVQDGIPIITGKISLSSLYHTGPVMFLSTLKCGLTFAPRSVSQLSLDEVDSTALASTGRQSIISLSQLKAEKSLDIEAADNLNDVESEEASNSDKPNTLAQEKPQLVEKRSSVMKSLQKVKNRISGGLFGPTSKNFGSTSNCAAPPRQSYPIARQNSSMMYGSLLRLDDFDDSTSGTDLLDILVPRNQLPVEQKITQFKISSDRAGSMKVKASTSISNLCTGVLRAESRHRGGIQSMWALSTTTSSSISSEPTTKDCQKIDEAFEAVNVELRKKPNHRQSHRKRRKCKDNGKFEEWSSPKPRPSRTVSISSILSKVAEDDECIGSSDEELSTLAESCDNLASMKQLGNSIDFSDDECHDDDPIEDKFESREGLVVTNYLKATLIISGGHGLLDLNKPNSVLSNEASLVLWQQTQTCL